MTQEVYFALDLERVAGAVVAEAVLVATTLVEVGRRLSVHALPTTTPQRRLANSHQQ